LITAVDTNILLDILIPGSTHGAASKVALETALSSGLLILSEVVYAELASQFPNERELDSFLLDTKIRLHPTNTQALQQASRAWKKYAEARPHGLQCTSCGNLQQPTVCPKCGQRITPRQHILSDFLVGAHALVHANRLLTRDRGFYRNYFSALELI
jgi:hypothetical protein